VTEHDPPLGPDEMVLSDEVHQTEVEEARETARIGVWIAPVVLAHVALILALVQAATGFRLPDFLHSDRVAVWLWVNGAAIAIGVWFWRKGRVPVSPRLWLKGRRAREYILLWLGGSLAWFLLPSVLADMWEALLSLGGDW
jgi:hypothetical protein